MAGGIIPLLLLLLLPHANLFLGKNTGWNCKSFSYSIYLTLSHSIFRPTHAIEGEWQTYRGNYKGFREIEMDIKFLIGNFNAF